MPLISVIVPVYNTEKYLHRCIDSILAQTFADFEVLLINDGSTDSSGAICDEYAQKDSRVRVFHKENGGVSSARNVGIDNSKGEWVAFVDSDDWIEKDFYSIILKNISEVDLIFISNIEHIEDGTIVTYQACDLHANNKLDIDKTLFYLKTNIINYPFYGFTWNKLFKKSIIIDNKIRFIDGFSLYEDELFTNNYCNYINSVRVLSFPLYHYRRTRAGLTCQVRNVKDLLLLSDEILMNCNNYILKDLITYEYKRALYFIQQAIYLDENYVYLNRALYLMKQYYNKSCIDVGRRLKLLCLMGVVGGKIFMSMFRFIFKKSFINT